jgi:hypothetical protein
MNIKHLLSISKENLIRALELSSTKRGADSYLFVPKQKENKPCLVAHIDTVWDKDRYTKPKAQSSGAQMAELYHDTQKGVIWSPSGLGADDRAGVYGVLKLLTQLKEPFTPYVLLTDLEESGGAGAYEAVDLYREELTNCTMFIELDRRGEDDCVFYSSEPTDFIEYIESFGFKEAIGTFSDISIISPEFERCAVNLSIGYYNEHTKQEYLNTKEMEVTIKKVSKLIKNAVRSKKHWTHIAPPTRWDWAGTKTSSDPLIECDWCGDAIYLSDAKELGYKCWTCERELNVQNLLDVGIY